MNDRPGLSTHRLARLVREARERCALDLSGAAVLTEAASDAYLVTSVLAALAGAKVVGVTADSKYGTVAEVQAATSELADELGVANRITVTAQRTAALFAEADVITNSGYVRPITGEFARAIKSGAVVPLMFETWEAQAGRLDIDVDALQSRDVQIAGTNERHPHVDVFSFLGPMAVAQLADAGVSAYRGLIAVLCNNAFSDYLVDGLKSAGADVSVGTTIEQLLNTSEPDALLVAMTPTGSPVLSAAQLRQVSAAWPGCVLAQFWGDIDRQFCADAGVLCWPIAPPAAGHMGVLPSRVGPEPIVRLQAGGLKVAQVLLTPPQKRSAEDMEYVDVY